MWQQAVIDRIVDGRHAVLLVGEEEVERWCPGSVCPREALRGRGFRSALKGNAWWKQ